MSETTPIFLQTEDDESPLNTLIQDFVSVSLGLLDKEDDVENLEVHVGKGVILLSSLYQRLTEAEALLASSCALEQVLAYVGDRLVYHKGYMNKDRTSFEDLCQMFNISAEIIVPSTRMNWVE